MMNPKPKILLLHRNNKIHPRTQAILDAADDLGKPIQFASFKDLEISTSPRLRITINGRPLEEFKVIFVRFVGKNWQRMFLISKYLEGYIQKKKVRIVDQCWAEGNTFAGNKSFQIYALRQAGLSVPKSVIGSLDHLKQVVEKKVGWPAVIKSGEDNQGDKVFLARDQRTINRLAKRLTKTEEEGKGKIFIAQKFIPNDGDYRIQTIGNKVIGAIFRCRQSKREFRNNWSLGGSVEPVDPPAKLKKIALAAAKACGVDYAGVDIGVHNKTGRPYIFEVNRGPMFLGPTFEKATGISEAKRIAKYLIGLSQ